MLAEIRETLHRLFFRRHAERRLAADLEFHLEQQIEENTRRGLSFEEARRRALIEFGGVAEVKEQCRESWGVRLPDELQQDLRQSTRALLRNPGYLVIAMATLALGIGSNTALFSVVHALVLQPLPYRDGGRLAVLTYYNAKRHVNSAGFSVHELNEVRSQVRLIEDVAEFHHMRFTLYTQRNTEVLETGVVSSNYFNLLGVRPLYGRLFLAGEDRENAPPVLLLSYRCFASIFGGDPSILGQTVRLNNGIFTVVGVLPPLPAYPQPIDVFIPTSSCPLRSSASFRSDPSQRMLTLFGHLKKGVTWTEANAELQVLSRRLRAMNPGVYPPDELWGYSVNSVREEMTRQARPTFFLLFGATGLVLLIACANVANLALARALKRGREMAARIALGCSRGRMLRQLLVEGLLISLPGGALGILLASQMMNLLKIFASRLSPRANEISLNLTVLIFSAVVSVLAGVIACAIPAWQQPLDLVAALKEGGTVTSGLGRHRVRGVLIAAQVAFSLILAVGAGLLFRSFINLLQVDPGFKSEHVLVMQVSPRRYKLTNFDEFRKFFERALDRLSSSPGIINAAICSRVPLDHQAPIGRDFLIQGQATIPGTPQPSFDLMVTSSQYFRTLSVPLLRGREFETADRAGAPQVAIISQNMARQRWPNHDPIGHRISLDGGQTWTTIVGVVGDVHLFGLRADAGEAVYLPFAQFPLGTNILIRTGIDSSALVPEVRSTIREIDPEAAIVSIQPLETIIAENLATPRLTATLVMLFAALTMLVTATGIGGVAGIAVSDRRIEIGIRLAIGARRIQVIGLIICQQMIMVFIGLVAGIAGAVALARFLASFVFHIPYTDLLTFLGAGLLLAAISAGACFIPAQRAAAVDPTCLLKSE